MPIEVAGHKDLKTKDDRKRIFVYFTYTGGLHSDGLDLVSNQNNFNGKIAISIH